MVRTAVQAILFDLDETLILEKPIAIRALEQTGQHANAAAGVRPPELRDRVLERAGELWRSTPVIDYCRRVGISSWEGLWAGFAGEDENLVWLREWSPTYRFEAWSRALQDRGVDDERLARTLAGEFVETRTGLFEHFPETTEILDELQGTVRLVLATNGASDLQRLKLETSGLAGHFDDVLVSADIGFAKPHPFFFENALRRANAGPEQILMVGDNILKDIGGAQAVGIRGIWVNRKDREPGDIQPFAEIGNLLELRKFL
ncbi:MAG: HAD family hydrolase [Gemmatimonadota bacterium]|nr:HAD family hydrolase [Gemmatimonadota bacterium]